MKYWFCLVYFSVLVSNYNNVSAQLQSQFRREEAALSTITVNIKDSNNCGGYALFARICINLVCCEEQLTFEQEGFYKGDSIQAEFQDCSCMFCSFDEVQKNATITLYSYEDDFQNTFEGFCPLNAVVNTKSGGYLFADFAGTNINTTPETNLTCQCSTYGSKSIYCNDAEFCECKPGFDGPKCDNCISESTRPFCEGGFRDTSLFRIPKTPEEFSSRIALVGGEGRNGKKTEIIDLIDPRLKCDLLTDTRLQWASVGGLVTNLPLICGGETDDGFGNKIASNECYPKTSLGRVFDMNENRRYAASVVLNNDTLWVTGGNNGNKDLSSTEFISFGQPSSRGPELPFSVNSHCMVQYDSSKVYLIGGYQSDRDNSETSKKTWIIDPTNGFVINRGPDLNEERFYHSCGKFNYNGRDILIVAGGVNEKGFLDSVEILDPLSHGENVWKYGPRLPFPIRLSSMVATPDGKGVVLVAGYGEEKSTNALIEFRQNEWIIMQQSLQFSRGNHVAFHIPEKFTNCKIF